MDHSRAANSHYKFKLMPEFFVNYHEIARQSPDSKVTTQPSFGLIDQPYSEPTSTKLDAEPKKPWERFAAYINQLNAENSGNVTYKVFYLTRHGLGVHNVFEAKVGREAWNNYWSHLDGDGTISWVDAKLTEDGVQQAEVLGRFWADAVTTEKVPLPGSRYTSPLARCLETTRLVFSKPMGQFGEQFEPVVKELLRERLTDHTCDKRSTRTWIEGQYPSYLIEPGFSEEDRLWKPDRWESVEEHVARKQKVLEEIFTQDCSPFISLTVHSYAISAILRACGYEEFRVREGSTIAVLIRAQRVV
ncbi:histidine phosphatase superfamily [Aspergillus pseudocaelatus]|uniref:Histidine phosphatase superfamily n=1 Tax=Aspergillus pseudocaelatus TaxID=1825620 RepID=A0ABQ6WBX2_9EURO|nr:histidine phosphatase superfamily [Aspergillus pseudocaelatus]